MSGIKSRAALLLEKEHFKMKRETIWGIHAEPFQSNIFHWEALVFGPKDTVWEGGVFKVFLVFNEEYDDKPPDVFFQTVPFHPNVDKKSGRPCIDFIDDSLQWRNYYNVQFILLSLQSMLAFPVLENAVNVAAAEMYKSSPRQYLQMVQDCVYSSRRLGDGLSPFLEMTPSSPDDPVVLRHEAAAPSKPAVKLSFEDYHALWNELATSQPGRTDQAALDNLFRKSLQVDIDSFDLMREEVQEELRRQMLEHNALMYGRFKSGKNDDAQKIADLQATRLHLLENLRKIREGEGEADLPVPAASRENLTSVTTAGLGDFPTNANNDVLLGSMLASLDDPADQEVLDLVQWTQNLPHT